MKFMNTWEVDEARARYARHPVLSRVTRLLADLRDLADAVSDGWCYWPKPARAAKGLMELVEKGDATEAEYRKAVGPVRAFLTREAKNLQGKTLAIP
jgi:phytoene/squalene synthetase